MTDTAAHHHILVGIDGSPSALHAARWAAREASRRRAPVRLFHVRVLTPGMPAPAAGPGQEWLREAEHAVHEVAPEVAVHQAIGDGGAAGLLIDESRTARLVVLGSHGLGGFPGMLLGSVSQGVAEYGHCPVVVVRGRTPGAAPPETGPVVVGVDGSPLSDAAVAFAFEEASLRAAPLVAVHTWTYATVSDTWAVLPFDADFETVAAGETRLLAERVSGWTDKYPDVEVRQQVLRDRPVRGLLGAAADAQLLVVGSRGHTAVSGMGLGSVSQTLLHHGTSPIAVVRPENAANERRP